jgi:hypothetical protein
MYLCVCMCVYVYVYVCVCVYVCVSVCLCALLLLSKVHVVRCCSMRCREPSLTLSLSLVQKPFPLYPQVKTLMQSSESSKYKGTVDCFSTLLKTEGFSAMYRYCRLSLICYLLSAICYLLSAICYLLSTVYCLLSVLLSAVYCYLPDI